MYFAIYFSCLHSLRHFHRCWRDADSALRPSPWREAVIQTLLALLGGLIAAVRLWGERTVDTVTLQVVFIGLVALTLPHRLIVAMAGPRAGTRQVNAQGDPTP